MKRYLVICEETCPLCKGKKSILLQGLVHWDDDAPQHLSEPEAEICDNCKGTGVIRKEVDISEAMRAGSAFALIEVPGLPKMHIEPDEPWPRSERPRPPVGDIKRDFDEKIMNRPPPEPVKRFRYSDISNEELERARKSWFYRIFWGIPKHLLD